MPLIQDLPLLTVYRSGIINLNGEATRLMHDAHLQVDLLPPASRRMPWQLDRRAGACCNLVAGGRNGSHLRFRAPYRAEALFADYPAEVTRIIFRITPNTQYLDLYTLAAELPVSNVPATVQQKSRRKAA
ncbi:hypothetical protein [Hymenobacter cellulosivorans]|uniref:Uncharacterized protein n=1 Tax=Hymenobacter cellulosivorans TaxID=2932249 RepID=A0ABY4FAW5_9BACT|nr:hypothetical protein [Hymenobacter cellulosivorans]UOQ53069.1 hypothetical protein MUN80_25445 [Hymenobacter cellulosivorans]